jgi:hypothetical protein
MTADLSRFKLCRTWNEDQAPFHVFGNTSYGGIHGLGTILIISPEGDVLIDGDLERGMGLAEVTAD